METIKELMQFLDESVTGYHAVKNVEKELKKAGFQRVDEKEIWTLEKGKKYYTVRNDSSIMAFSIPKGEVKGFRIFAAHSDSPAFKVKEHPEMDKEGAYVCINTEKYGGMILNTWLDRPLTIAGRICIEKEGELKTYPVKLVDGFCTIPNLAIHMNRDMNNGVALNPQIDMLPLYTMKEEKKELITYLCEAFEQEYQEKIKEEDILAGDLFVVNSEKAMLAGANKEFLMSAR